MWSSVVGYALHTLLLNNRTLHKYLLTTLLEQANSNKYEQVDNFHTVGDYRFKNGSDRSP
jgi:hypothetical protein